MEKTYKIKPGDTLVGLFDKIKKGNILHVEGINWESARSEASRNNKLARLLNEIGPYDKKFKVSKTLKKGYISIIHVDNQKITVN